MIYERVTTDDPIQQGDIFRNIPRVELSLSTLAVIDGDGQREMNWRDVLTESREPTTTTVLLPIKPVPAIVITQNCDAVRGEDICLCQIDDFLTAVGQFNPPKDAKNWQSLIIRHSKTNPRLFYLPPDDRFGLPSRMAADFRVILRVPRPDLENMKDFRIARLNHLAAEHFREALSYFFRRYAHNEWYSLNKEEFQAYADKCPEPVTAYPWQQ
jgi:hypothetical protein